MKETNRMRGVNRILHCCSAMHLQPQSNSVLHITEPNSSPTQERSYFVRALPESPKVYSFCTEDLHCLLSFLLILLNNCLVQLNKLSMISDVEDKVTANCWIQDYQ